jgi:two-component sensor histidine kinase
MAFHELCTNASKYGALGYEGAHIKVGWHTASDEVIVIWRETGVPIATKPTRRGFGAETIERSLPYMLGGDSRIEYHSDGVECVIRFPLAKDRKIAISEDEPDD